MTNARDQDRLLSRLLREVDRADETEASATDRHPDEETLALFALGELRGPERDELVRHLVECALCRQVAGDVMSWSGIAEAAPRETLTPKRRWGLKRPATWVGLAAAASLLVAFSTLIRLERRSTPGAATEAEAYTQANDLLKRGQFDEARTVVVEAARRGMESDRLRTIEAQALRRMPGMLALAYAGRLTDFDYEIGGVTARSATGGFGPGQAEAALNVLNQSHSADEAAALNRGHALLSLQRPREALADFRRVAERDPKSALARLGEGLACFALADYPAAEAAFRACLALDSNQSAARVNLAMTLAEEGKIDEALAAWEDVLARREGLSDEDRRAIQREIEELRAAQKNQKR